MKGWLAGFGAAIALVFAASAQAQAPAVEAYGRLPAVSDVAITPDGSRLAIAGFENGRSHVRIVNVDTGAVERMTQAQPGTKLRGVSWADNDRVLYRVSTAVDPRSVSGGAWVGGPRVVEYWRVGVFSRSTGAQRYIEVSEDYAWAHSGLTAIRSPIEGDPGTGRMIAWDISNNRLGVFRIPLDRGRPGTVGGGTAQTVDIILDDRGNIGARVDADQDTNRWRVFTYDGSRARQIMQGGHNSAKRRMWPVICPMGGSCIAGVRIPISNACSRSICPTGKQKCSPKTPSSIPPER